MKAETVTLSTIIQPERKIVVPWYTFVSSIATFNINKEHWEMSDYARRSHIFVANCRHFSDGELSAFGQFTTAFRVHDAEIQLSDDIDVDLEIRLREDAFLFFAVKVLMTRDVDGYQSTSGAFGDEWFTTTTTPIRSVLADRGFHL